MNRSVVIGIVIVLVVGAAAWVLTGKQGKNTLAPAPSRLTGQASPAAGAGGGNSGAFREQMTKFREEHKYTFQLTRLVGNIGRMEQEGQNKLTAAQAKAMLGILQPLRKQPKLNQDDAKEVIRSLQAVLTMDQRTEINKMPERRSGGGNRGGGAGGPGGQGGGAPRGQGGQNGGRPGGQRPQLDPAAMKDFNPFNSQSGGMGGPRAAARYDEFFKALEAKAKS